MQNFPGGGGGGGGKSVLPHANFHMLRSIVYVPNLCPGNYPILATPLITPLVQSSEGFLRTMNWVANHSVITFLCQKGGVTLAVFMY